MTGNISRRTVLGALTITPLAAAMGCQSVPGGLPTADSTQAEPVVATTLPPPNGEVIGEGSVRVALLVPLGAPGNDGRIGAELRNAARLAVEDFGGQSLQIVVKDTAGQPAQALALASEALTEGASAVLGPLFAAEVAQAASVIRPAGKIAIAFSSDQTVAGRGIYLNAFLPQGVADRSVAYAYSQGFRTMVGLVPNNAAGTLADNQLRNTMRLLGGNVLRIERYDPNDASVQTAISAIAAEAGQAQGIFVPDGGGSPNAIAAALRSNGVDLTGKKMLGTGLWASSNLGDPALTGAWFADTDQDKLAQYKARYRTKFGADPSTTSVLAYDSVALVIDVVRRHGALGLSPSVIESRSGFTGYGGVFRFGADGSNQRGYAVYEVQPGGGRRIVSPAPTSFGPAS